MVETAITLEQISQKIREFILANYLFGYDEKDFRDDLSFLHYGILDSTGIFELIIFIESEFSIEITDDEVLPENLDSIDCISRLIYKKITTEIC